MGLENLLTTQPPREDLDVPPDDPDHGELGAALSRMISSTDGFERRSASGSWETGSAPRSGWSASR